jgi:hypothetical protein
MRSSALVLAACIAVASSSALAAAMPAGAVVLPGERVDAMLHQCSRGAPAKGEATWQPGAEDIIALEALLPAALGPQFRAGDLRAAKAPAGWGRQYVGIVRGGRRFIYGNFFGKSDSKPLSPRDGPTIVCDGGMGFFGVEYDVAAHRITRVDFNGIA